MYHFHLFNHAEGEHAEFFWTPSRKSFFSRLQDVLYVLYELECVDPWPEDDIYGNFIQLFFSRSCDDCFRVSWNMEAGKVWIDRID